MSRSIFPLILMVFPFLFSCKKEAEPQKTMEINGLWQVEISTVTSYDNLDNITSIDTMVYTDNNGDTLTILERFELNNRFCLYSNSTADTIQSGLYTLIGSGLIIHLPDSVFPFNNRTVSHFDSNTMEFFQYFETPLPKKKWVQKYRRI